ncbi:MAG: SRPBCC family protein [Chloroflexota bacterium]|nr:SRPBCC family protein [Chloroflexota bacterium]
MFNYSHSIETPASAAAIWPLYSEVSRWPLWDHEVQEVVLDGPFVTGTSGTMQISGQPLLPIHLTEVTPNRSFSDETAMPDAGIVITFVHTLTPLATGGTRITHAVTISGPAAATVGPHIGPGIVADVPDAMATLAQHAIATMG